MVEDFVIDVSKNSATDNCNDIERDDDLDWLDDDDRLLIDCPAEKEEVTYAHTLCAHVCAFVTLPLHKCVYSCLKCHGPHPLL